MSFEDEFPSLKGKRYDYKNGCSDWGEYCVDGKHFLIEDVQEHTIDKEKVKEAVLPTLEWMDLELREGEVIQVTPAFLMQLYNKLKALGLDK